MGLRERQAMERRQRIVRTATELFAAEGFDNVSVERIAEAVGLSPATLYRYFPSKDLMVLGGLVDSASVLPSTYAATAPGDPLHERLATVVAAVLANEDADRADALVARDVIDVSPTARARLWDVLAEQRLLLAGLLGDEWGLPPDDPRVVLTARVALLVLETAADMWRAGNDGRTSGELAHELFAQLGDQALPLARVPRPADA